MFAKRRKQSHAKCCADTVWVSSQSRCPFSASFQAFCLTVRAYLRISLNNNDRDQVSWAHETKHLIQTLVFTKTAVRQPGWGHCYLRSSLKYGLFYSLPTFTVRYRTHLFSLSPGFCACEVNHDQKRGKYRRLPLTRTFKGDRSKWLEIRKRDGEECKYHAHLTSRVARNIFPFQWKRN